MSMDPSSKRGAWRACRKSGQLRFRLYSSFFPGLCYVVISDSRAKSVSVSNEHRRFSAPTPTFSTRSRRRFSSCKGVVSETFENVIRRDFSADASWQKIGSGVTEIRKPWGTRPVSRWCTTS